MSPLIDAVFLLLIFFLVATMFKKEKRDIDIVPPESASAVKMKPDDDVLVLGVTPMGEVYWQGRPITRTDLHTQLRSLSLSDPGRQSPLRRRRPDALFPGGAGAGPPAVPGVR